MLGSIGSNCRFRELTKFNDRYVDGYKRIVIERVSIKFLRSLRPHFPLYRGRDFIFIAVDLTGGVVPSRVSDLRRQSREKF